MRYRRMSIRYVVATPDPSFLGRAWSLASTAGTVLAQPGWRPRADVYETRQTFQLVIELASIELDDLEVLLFEDAVVIDGDRRLPWQAEGVYHSAEIPQGPFRIAVSLPGAIDPEGVAARADRGLLHLTLPKRSEP